MLTNSSRRMMRTLLDSLPEAVLVVGSSGRIIEANPPAERLLHKSEAELRAMGLTELARLAQIGGAAPSREPKELARVVEGEAVKDQHGVLSFGEEQTHLLVSAEPVPSSSQGEFFAAVVVLQDITDRMELERRLSTSERNQVVEHMAAGLIHDFNNVLETLQQSISVMELSLDGPAEQRKQHLRLMRHAVRRASELTQRLRCYLRDEQREVTTIELHKVLDDTLELMQPLFGSAHPGVQVRRELVPLGRVRGDIADLRRVFINLIINALEAMPTGGQLLVRSEPVQEGRSARILVRDSGHGIPPEQQKKIFKPYFTTKPRGTGLGLTGAKDIVRSFGGNIRFRSEPGQGTEFAIELPLIEDNPNPGEPSGHSPAPA